MKKKYTKPMIIIEDFSLDTTIAGSCDVKTDTQGYGECGLDMSGITIFLDGMSGCTFPIKNVGGDGEHNGLCYHVPTDSNLFNS